MAEKSLPTMKQFNQMLSPYMRPTWKAAVQQLLNTVLPLLVLWVLMFLSLRISYWLTLPLGILASGFLVRTFILFHDCGHNSFTPSVRANKLIGFFLGILVLTPGEQWWKSHAIHHATSGNLNKRGVGDVDTLTVEEYKKKSWLNRLGYNLFRFPPVMFGLGPIWMFLIMNRFPSPRFTRKETMSVVWTNLGLVIWFGLLSLLFGGPLNVAIVILPVVWLGGMMGIWMFYVQHQYEEVYWARDKEWSYEFSAVKGASYYQLPRILQWITGNIGFHHIHHLSPRIPNYNLSRAYDEQPLLRSEVTVIKFLEGFKTVRLSLINEGQRRMVSFRDMLG
jgi:omega-6 fatty acid desaturase (delta-12 desaturase)